MSLIEDNRSVVAMGKVSTFGGSRHNETRRCDTDLVGATRHVFRSPGADVVSGMIEPSLLVRPNGGGHSQFVPQLDLPLLGQRRRTQNENWPVPEKAREHARGREGKSLAE